MKSGILKLKLLSLFILVGIGVFGFVNSQHATPTAQAFFGGPPPSVTGAPGEVTCASCHFPEAGSGQFTITAPPNYTPGQTYQIAVTHVNAENSRRRWGFELTALNGSNNAAGTFANLAPTTQIITGMGRFYIEHTAIGTFTGQAGGANWTFNWTAPPTDVGPVTFYAAGNQANNDFTSNGDQIYTTNKVVQPAAPAPNPAVADLDGDGKTDVSIFRQGPGEWWYLRSSDGTSRAFQFGTSTDTPVPADFTGDGKTDIGFYRPSSGEWFILRSEDSSFFSFPFGTTGDIPIPGDYDGDGKADPTVFRPSIATWFTIRSSGGTTITAFGSSEDKPAVADYDGDGKDDIAIFRPSVSEWWINRSLGGVVAFQFGQAGDKTVQGDYTGDGKADVAVFRPSTGTWLILRSEDSSFFGFPFGTSGDIASPGDFDGDGLFDPAVFRPSTATWFIIGSQSGTQFIGFGANGDRPLTSVYSVP